MNLIGLENEKICSCQLSPHAHEKGCLFASPEMLIMEAGCTKAARVAVQRIISRFPPHNMDAESCNEIAEIMVGIIDDTFAPFLPYR